MNEAAGIDWTLAGMYALGVLGAVLVRWFRWKGVNGGRPYLEYWSGDGAKGNH